MHFHIKAPSNIFHQKDWLVGIVARECTEILKKYFGNMIEPEDLVSNYDHNVVLCYFLKDIKFGKDGDISKTQFINIINAYVANAIGESRTSSHL